MTGRVELLIYLLDVLVSIVNMISNGFRGATDVSKTWRGQSKSLALSSVDIGCDSCDFVSRVPSGKLT